MSLEEAIQVVRGIEKFFTRDPEVREALGIVLEAAAKQQKPKTMWYAEKWKDKHGRWEHWDESPSMFQMLGTFLRLRVNGYRARMGRYR